MFKSFARWFQDKSRQQPRRAGKNRKYLAPPRLEWLEDRLAPATVVVTTTQDLTGAPSGGVVSLRQAIDQTNASADTSSTITLANGTYAITLAGAGETGNASGDFDIKSAHALNLTIQGVSPTGTVIDASG